MEHETVLGSTLPTKEGRSLSMYQYQVNLNTLYSSSFGLVQRSRWSTFAAGKDMRTEAILKGLLKDYVGICPETP